MKNPPVWRTLAAGIFMAVAGFGGFCAWATLAPLSSAAVAPGIVTADTNRKTVQHLDGGVVGEILVRDGDHVEAGQVLMRLDDLETRSVVTLLEGQRRAYAAQEARLLAEQRHADRLVFPASLAALRGDPEMDEILTGQEQHLREPPRLASRAASPSRASASLSTMRRSGRSTRSLLRGAGNWR